MSYKLIVRSDHVLLVSVRHYVDMQISVLYQLIAEPCIKYLALLAFESLFHKLFMQTFLNFRNHLDCSPLDFRQTLPYQLWIHFVTSFDLAVLG